MRNVLFLILMLLVAGCAMRTYTVDQGKADFDVVTGERRAPNRDLKDKRKMFVWEIEMGNREQSKKEKPAATYDYNGSTDSSYANNDDYSSTYAPEETYSDNAAASTDYSYDTAKETAAAEEKTYTEYKVQKNDTLQKISDKFYGTTRKWLMIYEENKDVLKSPDKVYPGLTLRIPSK